MGRTLKRVPLDFSWPLNEVWKGYINPYWKLHQKCTACDGTGYSPHAKLYHDQWYGYAPFDPAEYGATQLTVDHPGVQAFARRNVERSPEYYGFGKHAIAKEARRLWELWRGQWSHHLIQADVDALVEAGRLMDFTRVPINDEQRANCHDNGWTKEPNGYRPTADEVNSWSLGGMGHDSINSWVCIQARCERAGVAHTCAICGGDGSWWQLPEVKKLHDDWQNYDPPTGDGYQLWETTSEGSPISPVFATLDELCAYAAINCSTFGSFQAGKEKWREMLDADFVVHQEGNNLFL